MMKGRIKTKFERGKTIAQCAGAAQTTQTNNKKTQKFHFSQLDFCYGTPKN
jgi:hypothetical protein